MTRLGALTLLLLLLTPTAAHAGGTVSLEGVRLATTKRTTKAAPGGGLRSLRRSDRSR